MTQTLLSLDVRSELLFAEDELLRGLRSRFVANLRRQLALGTARVLRRTLTATGILLDYGRYHENDVTTNLLAATGMFEKTSDGRRFDPDASACVYVVAEGFTPARILIVSLRPAADGALSVGIGTMPLVALVPADTVLQGPSVSPRSTQH